MKGKVVPIGSKAITTYYVALGTLVALLVAIIIGILISTAHLPPCTSIAQNICGVNDWSLAGLAAAILGVAATVLAFLGAFAVAVWWKELDVKVDARVNRLTEESIKLISANLQTQLQSYIDQRIQNLEDKLEKRFSAIDEERKRLLSEWHTLRSYVDGQDLILLEGVMSQPPWALEDWAKEWTSKAPASRIAFYMVICYMRVLDALLDNSAQQLYLKEIGAPFTDPQEYLKCALRWGDQIVDLSQGTIAELELSKRKKAVDTWKSQQP